ncbi:hypothetical protein OG622_44020 [Streptomyces sp. NBC_01314]|nr:hypothetical protein OG622_44020 [Streptomyces sp. NBC_01314]
MPHFVLLTLDQFQVYRRVTPGETVHQERDQERRQGRIAANCQAAGQLTFLGLGAGRYLVGLSQHRLGTSEDPAARLGERDPFRPTSYQQLHAEAAFEVGDRRGDAGLGGMAPHRRRAHGAGVRHSDEVFQLAEGKIYCHFSPTAMGTLNKPYRKVLLFLDVTQMSF